VPVNIVVPPQPAHFTSVVVTAGAPFVRRSASFCSVPPRSCSLTAAPSGISSAFVAPQYGHFSDCCPMWNSSFAPQPSQGKFRPSAGSRVVPAASVSAGVGPCSPAV